MTTENYQAENLEFADAGAELSDEMSTAIDDDWYSDGFTDSDAESEEKDEAGEEEAEADQPDETENATENKAEESSAPPAEAHAAEENGKADNTDQRFLLKHLDETKEVGRDEVIALAQKGLDYDRKTEKLNAKIAGYEEFFDELAAPSGLSREQFMDSVRAKIFVASEAKEGRTISEADALFKVQNARAERAKATAEAAAKEQQEAQAAKEQRTREALSRFAAARPEVKATDIPQSVWEEFSRSGDLEAAFAKHENAELRQKYTELESKVAALEKNAENAKHSTGSRKSAGASSSDSAFDKLWYDGT